MMPLAGLGHFLDTFARRMGFAGVMGNRSTTRYYLTPKGQEAIA